MLRELSFITLFLLLCQHDIKAVGLITCEGETSRLTCGVPPRQVLTCESDTARLSCDQGYIKVISANYGRTNSATCSAGRPGSQLSNVQCVQSTSLTVMANQCDGKQDCSVPVSNSVFSDPCYGTYKYLTVSYTCVLTITTCEGNTLRLNCENQFIKVLSANYGRTKSVTCSSGKPASQLSNVQCVQSTSLTVLASRCDGKPDCSVPVSNKVFGNPCYGTFKYLNVSYTCLSTSNPFIKVISANYGRTNRATCSAGRPASQLSNVQCVQSTSAAVLASRCDGKQDCFVPVCNTVFSDPCYGTYKYLELSYNCVPN